jgi:predicted component of type VI protein secretion system
MAQARIIIKEPNGVQRAMPLTPRGVTIGRGTDNNLILNYPITSRYHAQVTFDGNYYYVTDLNSGNGTFLDDVQLSPHEPVVWMPGMSLRIGDVLVLLEISQYQAQPQQAAAAPRSSGGGHRDRQNTETIAGWVPALKDTKDTGRSRLLIIVLVLVFLCACVVAGLLGYFYFL